MPASSQYCNQSGIACRKVRLVLQRRTPRVVDMAPNVASNGLVANGNGVHQNGKGAVHSNGNGAAARPAVAPKSSHEDRWAGVERPYSQVCFTVPTIH